MRRHQTDREGQSRRYTGRRPGGLQPHRILVRSEIDQIHHVAGPPRLSQPREDKLDKLINICATAEDRSRADWNVLCWALEHGVPADEL
jgi:hypothetical protein